MCLPPPPTQTTYRGVKNPEAVERKRKKQEEIEKQAMTTSASGGGGLKVGAVTLWIVILPAKLERFLCPPSSGRWAEDPNGVTGVWIKMRSGWKTVQTISELVSIWVRKDHLL